MAEQNRTVPARCDLCEIREADGIDDQGYPLCTYCAGRMRGARDEEGRLLTEALKGTLEWVRAEGLAAQEIRNIVDAQLAGEGLTDAIVEQLEQQFDEQDEGET
jgi:hypothetical protein